MRILKFLGDDNLEEVLIPPQENQAEDLMPEGITRENPAQDLNAEVIQPEIPAEDLMAFKAGGSIQ